MFAKNSTFYTSKITATSWTFLFRTRKIFKRIFEADFQPFLQDVLLNFLLLFSSRLLRCVASRPVIAKKTPNTWGSFTGPFRFIITFPVDFFNNKGAKLRDCTHHQPSHAKQQHGQEAGEFQWWYLVSPDSYWNGEVNSSKVFKKRVGGGGAWVVTINMVLQVERQRVNRM